MSATEIYPASLIKRHRATKAEVERRRECLYEIVEAIKPMTVRQCFYQASVHGKERASADSRAGGHDAAEYIMSAAPIIARVIESHPAMAGAERPLVIDLDRKGSELACLACRLALERIGRDMLKKRLRS
jgi:hypothetical protein